MPHLHKDRAEPPSFEETIFNTSYSFKYKSGLKKSGDSIEAYKIATNTLPAYSAAPLSSVEPVPENVDKPQDGDLAYTIHYLNDLNTAELHDPSGFNLATVDITKPLEPSVSAFVGSETESDIGFTHKKHAYGFSTSQGLFAWVDQSKENDSITLLFNPEATKDGYKGGIVVGRLVVTDGNKKALRLDIDSGRVSESLALGSIVVVLRSKDYLNGWGKSNGFLIGFGTYSAFEFALGIGYLVAALPFLIPG